MDKRELYKKYVETFGNLNTFLDVIVKMGDVGITICLEFLKDEGIQSTHLHFSEKFIKQLADALITIERIHEMMSIKERQQFFIQKQDLLNQMERDIRKKEL